MANVIDFCTHMKISYEQKKPLQPLSNGDTQGKP